MNVNEEKITCRLCGLRVHGIKAHLAAEHPGVTVEEYKEQFPDSPVLSKTVIGAMKRIETLLHEEGEEECVEDGVSIVDFHRAFKMRKNKETTNANGDPIPIQILSVNEESKQLIPEIDSNYVFDAKTVKNVLMALEMNMPLYLWGHAGTGKTSVIEQVAARTNRPLLRVQHTVNTEESHIVGQWTARGGETVFELGPLAMAMKNGWIYLADEYDFAMPSVLAVYQPILEGKALLIKEADEANRIIKPHKNFRFVATGNTNGSGDETGLYQGTSIQNAANYDRFNVTIEVKYMTPSAETNVITSQSGVRKEDAECIVDFANRIRNEYKKGSVSIPISPRALIAIATIGLLKGSFREGIELAYSNKLSEVDKGVADGLAQRIFG